MNFNRFFTEDRAVSPVIGVILMVAITVILAAVIGTFVLGLGDQVGTTAPTTQFGFDQEGEADDGDASVTVIHEGGDSIDNSNLQLTLSESSLGINDVDSMGLSYSEVSAGKSIVVAEDGTGDTNVDSGNFNPDEELRVIWTSDSGDDSQVIADYQIN